jgi:hypothetical protein
VTSRPFERFAAGCAVAVGLSALAYAAAFIVVLKRSPENADAVRNAVLLAGGLLSTAVYVALYDRLRAVDSLFALWGFIIGIGGALGSVAHGGFELAKIAHKTSANTDFANPVDPRGLFTFGLSAVAAFVFAWLIVRGGGLPRELGYLAVISGLLLLVVYFGRLIIFDPESPGLFVVAVIVGFVVNPGFYLWLGRELWRGAAVPQPSA